MTILDEFAWLSTGAGVGVTIEGALNLGDGDLVRGARKIIYGLAGTNFGARYLGFSDSITQDLMQYSLCQGIALTALNGICHAARGFSQKRFTQFIKGAAQSGMGALVFCGMSSMDAKTFSVAHQALLVTLASSHLAKSGSSDIANENYKMGVCKLLLSVGGIVGAGYGVYLQLLDNQSYSQALPPDELTFKQNAFIDTHEKEIELIYKNSSNISHSLPENWNKIGNGGFKRVYSHPEFDRLIKVTGPKFRDFHLEKRHYDNLQEAKQVVHYLGFSHIKIPACNLVEISQSVPILVEEKLDLLLYKEIPDGPLKNKAEIELAEFTMIFGLDDVNVETDHNAGFLNDTNDGLKIGVFDFDQRSGALSMMQSGFAKIATYCTVGIEALGRVTQAIVGKEMKYIVWVAAAAGAAAMIGESDLPFSADTTPKFVEFALLQAGIGAAHFASFTAASAIGIHLALKVYSYASKILSYPCPEKKVDS